MNKLDILKPDVYGLEENDIESVVRELHQLADAISDGSIEKCKVEITTFNIDDNQVSHRSMVSDSNEGFVDSTFYDFPRVDESDDLFEEVCKIVYPE